MSENVTKRARRRMARRTRIARGGAGDPMDKISALRQDAEIQFLETKTQALKKSIENAERLASSNISRNDNQKNTNRVNIVFKAISGIAKPFGILLRDLAPYIALVVVIMILIGVGVSTRGPTLNLNDGSARRDAIFNQTLGILDRIKIWIGDIFRRFSLGHRFKLIMRMLNPFGGYQNTIDRPRAGYGRCNNIDWVENGENCENLLFPKAIEWEVSPDKIAEWERLPDDIKSGLKKKLKIYVPWEKQDTFYVPQCAKAYYVSVVRDLATGKAKTQQNLLNADERTRFLQDTGLECVRVQKTLPKTFSPEYRAKSGPNGTAISLDKYTKKP